MARTKGKAIFAVNFEPTGQSPLDARLVVGQVSDLTNEATYADNNVYNGMVVSVLEDNSLHMLTNMSDITNPVSWKRLDSGSTDQDFTELKGQVEQLEKDVTALKGTDEDTPESVSITGAKKYADEKSNQAKTEAVEEATSTAAEDATSKANTAEQNAKDYADEKDTELKNTIGNYTVNGHKISENPELTKDDVGLSSVTNDAQVKRTEMGVANGVATLDENGKVPVSQLNGQQAPVQGVDEVVTSDALPDTSELPVEYMVWCTDDKKFREWNGSSWDVIDPKADTIYNFRNSDATGDSERTNILYRWDGSNLTEISASIALGETSGTAYEGIKGKQNRDAIQSLPATIISALGEVTANATQITIPITLATKSGLNYGEASQSSSLIIPVATGSAAGLMSAADKAKFDEVIGDSEGSFKEQIDQLKTTVDNYTVNGKKISTNPTLGGGDILLSGYSIAGEVSPITESDSINVAIGKLEKAISDNKSTADASINKINQQLGFSDGNYQPTDESLSGKNVTQAIDHIAGSIKLVPNYYETNATDGSSMQIKAETHKCGTIPMVQTYLGTELVECAVSLASNGDITVSWNGSVVSSGTPLKIIVIGR